MEFGDGMHGVFLGGMWPYGLYVIRMHCDDTLIAGKILFVQCQDVSDTMHVHCGSETRIMNLNTLYRVYYY